MHLTDKKDLQKMLAMYGVRLSKEYGQNFLVSDEVLAEILWASDLDEKDFVLETGAGVGTLTLELMASGARVHTIEIDKKLLPILRANLALHENVEITAGDALEIPVPEGAWKWVANLPYQITAPLFKRFICNVNPPTLAVLMVQKEVALKLIPRKGKYDGRLALLVNNFMNVEMVCRVDRAQFFPPPKVDSAVIKLTRREEPFFDLPEWSKIEKLMEHLFQARRKKLSNTLPSFVGWKGEWQKSTVDLDKRPEDLSLDEWREFLAWL